MNRNTCRVNLNESRVCEVSTLTVASHRCCTVTTHSVCTQEISVTVTTGCDNNCMSCKTLEFTCYKVFSDDTTCATVDDYYIFHLDRKSTRLNSSHQIIS